MLSPICFTNFSQFEQLKKKTNFLLVQTSFFSQFASSKTNHNKYLLKKLQIQNLRLVKLPEEFVIRSIFDQFKICLLNAQPKSLNGLQSIISKVDKVLSLLEVCFDLISGSSLFMKIQIMGWKITENLGFKSSPRKFKKFLSFFLFIFKFSIKN